MVLALVGVSSSPIALLFSCLSPWSVCLSWCAELFLSGIKTVCLIVCEKVLTFEEPLWVIVTYYSVGLVRVVLGAVVESINQNNQTKQIYIAPCVASESVKRWQGGLGGVSSVKQLRFMSRKSQRLCRFKMGWDEMWHECSSHKYALTDGGGLLIWHQNFKMAAMKSFHAAKCCAAT